MRWALLVLLACEGSPPAPTPIVTPAVTPHPVAAQPVAVARPKPCGDACVMRTRATLEGIDVVELRWATTWDAPFERFELHIVKDDAWGPLLLRAREGVTYQDQPQVSARAEDVDAGRLALVDVRTRWRDSIGGEQSTHEIVICKLEGLHCRRVQADSSYRSPEGSELARHFDVQLENSRLLVRTPDAALCGAPPPGAVRTEDEPELLWFGSHPWADIF